MGSLHTGSGASVAFVGCLGFVAATVLLSGCISGAPGNDSAMMLSLPTLGASVLYELADGTQIEAVLQDTATILDGGSRERLAVRLVVNWSGPHSIREEIHWFDVRSGLPVRTDYREGSETLTQFFDGSMQAVIESVLFGPVPFALLPLFSTGDPDGEGCRWLALFDGWLRTCFSSVSAGARVEFEFPQVGRVEQERVHRESWVDFGASHGFATRFGALAGLGFGYDSVVLVHATNGGDTNPWRLDAHCCMQAPIHADAQFWPPDSHPGLGRAGLLLEFEDAYEAAMQFDSVVAFHAQNPGVFVAVAEYELRPVPRWIIAFAAVEGDRSYEVEATHLDVEVVGFSARDQGIAVVVDSGDLVEISPMMYPRDAYGVRGFASLVHAVLEGRSCFGDDIFLSYAVQLDPELWGTASEVELVVAPQSGSDFLVYSGVSGARLEQSGAC